jgi:tight adherence protein C
MRWTIAGGFVCAAALLGTGLALRLDPRVRARLGISGPRQGASVLEAMGRWIPARRARSKVIDRLGGAGGLEVHRVMGKKLAAAAAGAFLGITLSPGPGAIAIAALLGLAGWRLPDFLLARRTRANRARAEAAIPELLDLVAVSVTAGLTPRLALDRAGRALSGPLAAELASARRAVELGESWAAVLRRIAQRLDLRDLRRLASTLDQSSRLGSPVAERLRGLAREVRAERRVREEERARRAPVAMLFPLVLLILPAFVLAAVVPTILVATRGIR